MWNSKTLKPPPMCEMKVQLTPACKDTLNIARLCATQACKPLQDHLRLFEAELYVTKRIIYKFSDQFRSDKALKSLRQVYTCLKRLEVLDLLKQLTEFGESVGRIAFDDDQTVYLPSRQCFEYQLVRLQGAGALLRQTANYSQQTFIYVREYLKVGNMVSQNVVMLAICSRIWYVSNSLCQYVCKWYSKFYNCLTYLKPTAVLWLRDGETIPSDITQWLKEMFVDSQLTQEDSDLVEQITSNNNTTDMVESETTVVSSEEVPSIKPTQNEDIGEVIQRSAVRKVITKMSKQSPGMKQNQSKGKRKAESSNLDSSDEYLTLSLTKVPRVQNYGSDEDESQSSDESFGLTENTEAGENDFDKEERSEVIGNSNEKFQTREKITTSNKVDTISEKARFNDRIKSVKDVESVLEQVQSGSIEFNGKFINLADHKIVHVMKAIGKIKKRMESNMTRLMGQQMYVKKVKQCLNKILWSENQSNNVTKTNKGSNKVHSVVNLNESETAVLGSPGIRQSPITEKSPSVGKEAKKKKKKKKKKLKGDASAEKTDVVRSVTVSERGDNDSKTKKKTKKRKKSKKNKSGQ